MLHIAVVTGSRAEFGIFKWLIRALQVDSEIDCKLIVTGSHLSKHHGYSISEIESEGFAISEKVELFSEGDDPLSVANAIGNGVQKFSALFFRLKPEYIFVLGDRYEIFAVAQAAFVMGIPIVHFHGGERTDGAMDDVFRHSISLMSSLHFTANEAYRQRLIQFGIKEETVYSFGSPGMDEIFESLKKKSINHDWFYWGREKKHKILVTFHPVTASVGHELVGMNELIHLMESMVDCHFLITGANADQFGTIINEHLIQLAERMPDRIKYIAHLGRANYLDVLKQVDVVLGNSSSGIIEAAYFKVPTINVGSRQDGRMKPDSVIDCATELNDIRSALIKGLSKEFRYNIRWEQQFYGSEGVTEKIIQAFKHFARTRMSSDKCRKY